jgi:hypothetical protein
MELISSAVFDAYFSNLVFGEYLEFFRRHSLRGWSGRVNGALWIEVTVRSEMRRYVQFPASSLRRQELRAGESIRACDLTA